MTDINKKEACLSRRCINKNSESEYKAVSEGEICDSRDLKLKEAEKTIANKDVIIKMLQQHVKKLEDSYKQNLKTTEDFRFKFCLASEQVRRMRSCPSRQKEKELKELKCDLSRWKQQYEDYMSCKDHCSNFNPKCNFMQKIRNVEKFMKAHYELLESLVEKISGSNIQVDKTAMQPVQENYNNEITQIRNEIENLKFELLKIQEHIYYNARSSSEKLLEVKDSILETYKKTNHELQKKVSTLVEKIPNAEALLEEDENEEDDDEKVYLGANRQTARAPSTLSFNPQVEIVEDNPLQEISEETLETDLMQNIEAIKEKEKCAHNTCCTCSQGVQVRLTPKTNIEEESASDKTSETKGKEKSISINEETESESIESEADDILNTSNLTSQSNQHKTPSMFSAGVTAAGSREMFFDDSQNVKCVCGSNTSNQRKISSEGSVQSKEKFSKKSSQDPSIKSKDNSISIKESVNASVQSHEKYSKKSSENSSVKSKDLSVSIRESVNASVQSHEKSSKKSSENSIIKSKDISISTRGSANASVQSQEKPSKKSSENSSVKSKDISVSTRESVNASVQSEEKYLSAEESSETEVKKSISLEENSVQFPRGESAGTNDTLHTDRPVETPTEMNESTKNVTCTCESTIQNEEEKKDPAEEPVDDSVPSISAKESLHTSIDSKEKSKDSVLSKNDLNDMNGKLNEINDKVSQLVETQMGACKELQTLKNEMTITRNSTQSWSENIAKLKETIEAQEETFLNNFREQKVVTDGLTEKNEIIQQELKEMKNKIEILFRNWEGLKNTCRVSGSSGADEVLTVENCKLTIGENEGTDRVTQESIGEPSVVAEQNVENKIQSEPIEQKETNLEKLQEEVKDLEQQHEVKDEKIKCINALISYYINASKQVSSMFPKQASGEIQKKIDEHLKSCNCGGEAHEYIEKIRGENLKLKTTISSVIDHLKGKMNELKEKKNDESNREKKNDESNAEKKNEESNSLCLCIPQQQSNDLSGYQSDVSSLDSSTVICDPSKNICNPELEIEDIYNVVRQTFAGPPKKDESSCSCLCTSNPTEKLPFYCCSDCFQSEGSNLEDIYHSILCSCDLAKSDQSVDKQKTEEKSLDNKIENEEKSNKEANEGKCTGAACIAAEKKLQSENEDKNKETSQHDLTDENKQICVIDTCGETAQCSVALNNCSEQSLMNNLQTYVDYLHQQLNIITNIEGRIEELRKDIHSP